MLAVIEILAVDAHLTRAPAQRACRFEQNRAMTLLREFDRRRATGPSSADYGYPSHASSSHISLPCQPEFSDRGQGNALIEHMEAITLDLVEQRVIDRCHDQAGALRAAVLLGQKRKRFI